MARKTKKQIEEEAQNMSVELDTLEEVAYLMTVGHPTESAYWNVNTSRVVFLFPQNGDVEDHVDKYRNNEAKVDPKEYMRNYVQAKRLMFGLRRQV